MKVLVAIVDRMLTNPNIESIEAMTFWPAWQEIADGAALIPMHRYEREFGRDSMNNLFLRCVQECQPDLVFTVAFRDNWLPGVIEQVSCPTVVWFSDSYRGGFLQQQAPRFDMAIVMDELGEAVLADHPNVKRSMWACNPALHCPGRTPRDLDVVFVGGTHGTKEHYLHAVRGLALHGRGRKDGLVTTTEYVGLYQRAKIGLAFTMSADRRTPQPKARLFETPAMGAMLLAQESTYLDGYLKRGKEYDTFNSPEELVEKVEYYLAHNRKRRAIARAGCKRVRTEHTYVKRMEEVVRWIESV